MPSQLIQLFSGTNIAESKTLIKQAQLTSLNSILPVKLLAQWCDQCQQCSVSIHPGVCPYCLSPGQTISSILAYIFIYESYDRDIYFCIKAEENDNFKFVEAGRNQDQNHAITEYNTYMQANYEVFQHSYLIINEKEQAFSADANDKVTKQQNSLLSLPEFIGTVTNHAKLNPDIILGKTMYFQIAQFVLDSNKSFTFMKPSNINEQIVSGTEMQESIARYFNKEMFSSNKQEQSGNLYLIKNTFLPTFMVIGKVPLIKDIYLTNSTIYINNQVIQLIPGGTDSIKKQSLPNDNNNVAQIKLQQQKSYQFALSQSKLFQQIIKQRKTAQHILESATAFLNLFEDNFIAPLIRLSLQTINMTKHLQRFIIRILAGSRFGDNALFVSQQPEFYRFITTKVISVIQSIQMHICLQNILKTKILRASFNKRQTLEINDSQFDKSKINKQNLNVAHINVQNYGVINFPLQSGGHWNEYDFKCIHFQNYNLKQMINRSKSAKYLYKISANNTQQDKVLVKVNFEQGKNVVITHKASELANIQSNVLKAIQVNGQIVYVALDELVHYHFASKQTLEENATFLPYNIIFENELKSDLNTRLKLLNINSSNRDIQKMQQIHHQSKLSKTSTETDQELTDQMERKPKTEEKESLQWLQNASVLVNQLFIQESMQFDCSLILSKCELLFTERKESSKILFKSLIHMFSQVFRDQDNDIILGMAVIVLIDLQKLNIDILEFLKTIFG